MALNQGFLGHIELGQCRKCNYSLKRTQNFRLFVFVGQAVLRTYSYRGYALQQRSQRKQRSVKSIALAEVHAGFDCFSSL